MSDSSSSHVYFKSQDSEDSMREGRERNHQDNRGDQGQGQRGHGGQVGHEDGLIYGSESISGSSESYHYLYDE